MSIIRAIHAFVDGRVDLGSPDASVQQRFRVGERHENSQFVSSRPPGKCRRPSGSKGAAAQFVVGASVTGHPARQFLVRIGAARGVDLGHVGRVLGELDDEPVG